MSGRFSSIPVDRHSFSKPPAQKFYLLPNQLKQIKDEFSKCDKNNKKEIDLYDLKNALENIGIELGRNRNDDLSKIIDEVENKGELSLDFDYLIDSIAQKMDEIIDSDSLMKVFLLYLGDEDIDGLDFEHLKKFCNNLNDEKIKEIVKIADKDEDGKICFEDFQNTISQAI